MKRKRALKQTTLTKFFGAKPPKPPKKTSANPSRENQALPQCLQNLVFSYLPIIYYNNLRLKCSRQHCWCADYIQEGYLPRSRCSSQRVLTEACRKGYLVAYRDALAKGARTSGTDVAIASQHGHLELIKLMARIMDHFPTQVALRNAEYYEQRETLNWLTGQLKNPHIIKLYA